MYYFCHSDMTKQWKSIDIHKYYFCHSDMKNQWKSTDAKSWIFKLR